MATVDLSALSGVMNLTFSESLAVQLRRDVLLPNLIAAKVPAPVNSTVSWGAKFTNRSAGGAYAEGADMADADFDSHTKVPASLPWVQYRKGAKISGLAEAISRQNGSSAFNLGEFREQLDEAVDDLAKDISAHSWTGNVAASPPQLAGLSTSVASSGTYANINSATYSEWASAQNTGLLVDVDAKYLREKLHRPLKDNCGIAPTFVLCDGTTWDLVGDSLTDNQRQLVETVRTLSGESINIIDAGYRAFMIDGVAYIEDKDAPANTLFAFARDAIHYEHVPAVGPAQAGEIITMMKDLSGVTLQEDEVVAMIRQMGGRLTPTIKMLGATGDSFKAMVKVYAQIVVKYRNRCAKLTLS